MATEKVTTQMFNQKGEKVKEVTLNPDIFGVEINENVVHQVAMAQMANSRTTIAHTKDRSEVRGGGHKPWKQKGTGNARHGSRRSPIWVGGGVTFGPTKDRNWSQKVNKKMKTKALFMCLTDKIVSEDRELVLIDNLEIKEKKTRDFVKTVETLKDALKLKAIKESKKFDIKNYKKSILVVVAPEEKDAFVVTRNLEKIKTISANSLNVVDLLKFKDIIMTEKSLPVIEATYLKK
jgi:large subunit ribosomal protein L4